MINTDTSLYLGPGEMVTVGGHSGLCEVRLATGETKWARLALASFYVPMSGDEVLIACQDMGDAYVIGVLKGGGVATLEVPGDLTLRAPQGSLRLEAAGTVKISGVEAVEVSTRKATFRVKRLNILATTIVERIANVYTWATGLVQVKGARLRTVAEDGWFVRAGRGHVKTAGNLNINGKTIHLG